MTGRPFEEIVVEHGPVVMRVCRAMLGPVDAEDAWADTFVSALEAYPRLRAGSNVRGWLVTIAHRKAIDQHRGRTRRPTPTDRLPDRPVWDDTAGETDTQLWAALASLPFKQRGAVAYRYLADLSYADIGVLLDSSESAARRSAADGIAHLRRIYPRGTTP